MKPWKFVTISQQCFFSNLARLVPSTEFEQKRRQINKHLLDEIEKDEEPVLCGKKKKKKKKKKNEDENEETIMLRIYKAIKSPLRNTKPLRIKLFEIAYFLSYF